MRSLTRTATQLMLLALSLLALGCGDDDSSSVSSFSACGGNPEGKWTLVDLKFDDPSQLIGGAILNESACKGAIRNVDTNASGSYTFNADKTYSIDIEYGVSAQVLLSNACLKALSDVEASASVCQMLADSFVDAAGYLGTTCNFTSAACDCALHTPDVPVQVESTWSVKGDQLLLGQRETPFCVDSGRLQLLVSTDDGSNTGVTGVIILKQ